MSDETPLMQIIHAAAERFDKRPAYRASIQARAELQSTANRMEANAPAHAQQSGTTPSDHATDSLGDEDRVRLHASIDRGLADVEAGRTVDAQNVIDRLRARAR